MALNPFLASVAGPELRIVKTQVFPERWREFCGNYDLEWAYTPFDVDHVDEVGGSPGVYCFHVGHDFDRLPPFGLSLYGGITKRSLRTRCREYVLERDAENGRFWVRKFLNVFDGELTFAWSEVDLELVNIDQLERDFNDAMMPPYSRRDFSADVRAGRNAWQ